MKSSFSEHEQIEATAKLGQALALLQEVLTDKTDVGVGIRHMVDHCVEEEVLGEHAASQLYDCVEEAERYISERSRDTPKPFWT